MCLDLYAVCSYSLIALSCGCGVNGPLAFYLDLRTDRLQPGIKSNALSSLVQCLVREIITTTERKLSLPPSSIPFSLHLSPLKFPVVCLFSLPPSFLTTFLVFSSSSQLSSLHSFNNTFPMIREN